MINLILQKDFLCTVFMKLKEKLFNEFKIKYYYLYI